MALTFPPHEQLADGFYHAGDILHTLNKQPLNVIAVDYMQKAIRMTLIRSDRSV
eukprot:gene28774-35691_t